MTSTLSSDLILNLLPEPPDDGYSGYEVDQMSHMWWRVWLLHAPYLYKTGVRTVWGFIKKTGKVYAPFTPTRARTEIVCDLNTLFKQNSYTLIRPVGGSLLHLL